MNPYHDPEKPHHRARGFQNNYVEYQPKSLSECFLRREDIRNHLPPRRWHQRQSVTRLAGCRPRARARRFAGHTSRPCHGHAQRAA